MRVVFQKWFKGAFLLSALCFISSASFSAPKVSGIMRVWHPVVVTLNGTSVDESLSTFRNYRLDVTFTKGNKSYKVPGFFAADGNAAETSATSGNKWRAIFTPDEAGIWNYSVSFRTGKDITISFDPNVGTPISDVDGLKGSFKIASGKKNEQGFFAKGKLNYVGEHFGQFAGNKEWHVKAGPGSPEDFFGYHLGMRFNLGEELKQTGPQQAAAAKYLKYLDPYNTIISGHSSHRRESQVKIFEHLLGNKNYDGPNYQLHENEKRDHLDIIMWRDRSAAAGHKWIVANDESWGIDNTPNGEKRMLTYVWRTHMAGAEGMFQYTAYNIPEIGDITMENFRLIENTQRIHIACKDLFLKPEINPHLPKMRNENALVGNPAGNGAPFCFAKKGELYIVYRTSEANQTPLDLTGTTGVFTVKWYNALKGGGEYQLNDMATVLASANTCNRFDAWTENGEVVSREPNYTFRVTGARNLKANLFLYSLTESLTMI